VVATRVPFATFRTALGNGPHVLLAVVDLAVVAITLGTDAFATWVSMIALRLRRPFRHVFAIRGATFALFIVNYVLGQGGFGYYLHRTGTSALRAVGATLFLIGTNLAALLLVTSVASLLSPVDDRLWWSLVIGCAALAAYLVVIAVRPGPLARRELLAPLFDAGLRGNAIAIAVRLPHVIVMSFGLWLAIRAWGIPVPISASLTVMPIVVIAQALPIAPAGLGTTQAAFVLFFSSYAAGATGDDRAAAVLAFAIVHFVYQVVAMLMVGFACLPIAKRTGVLAPAPVSP
jgi:uncharacterized membrane protein YbhN (UPF0104 family)